MTIPRDPYIKDGFFTYGIDAAADAWYGIDLAGYLQALNTTLAGLSSVAVAGLTQTDTAKIVGTQLLAKLANPDTSDGAHLACTFHFRLANGDVDVATIKFEVESH